MRDAGEIECAVGAFARESNGGVNVTASMSAIIHRELITTLAARNKLPAVYYERFWVAGGGLMSYGPDFRDQFRRAAASSRARSPLIFRCRCRPSTNS